jgi:signal transduction histidine kinase
MDAATANTTRDAELSIRTTGRSEVVEVAVRDNGAGVPPALSERIFSPFYSTKPNGLGMGLAISRAIIESHSGKLWIDSGDPGATFLFRLPAAVKGVARGRL